MRWVITGAAGQLGSDLTATLAGEDVVALARSDLDLADAGAVSAAIGRIRPDAVLNAAAYTAVDAAETDEGAAYAANATGPANLARACAETGARLVHVSTDYVFAGDSTAPYEVDAPTAPRSAYGRTKRAGEQLVAAALPDAYVVRTAWVYGASGGNFVKTMIKLERAKPFLEVVDDQHGSPTWSADLAGALVALARSGAAPGVYHCTNAGETTWCGLARAVFEELGADPDRVRPTTSDAFPRPAPRPAYSVLSDRAWVTSGLPALRPWRDALHQAFADSGDALRVVS